MFDVKGDKAQWLTVYDHLATMQIGDVVTDEQLAELLPDAAEASRPGAFRRAVREMEDQHKRSFDRERLVGYRMVEAVEHERLARSQHRRSKRAMRQAYRKSHAADRRLLDQEQRRRMDALELHLAAQRQMIARLSSRQDTVEALAKSTRRETKADVAELAAKVDRLNAALERHGITRESIETP